MTWSADNTVRLWDAESGDGLQELDHADWVNGAIWNNDESRIMSWSHTRVYLWDENGELITQLPHDNLVNGAAWNSTESQILSWGWDGNAYIWES